MEALSEAVEEAFESHLAAQDDVINGELYAGIRMAMVALSKEVSFLLQLKLSPEAWGLQPAQYIGAAMRRRSIRTWYSLERHWAEQCAGVQPNDPPGRDASPFTPSRVRFAPEAPTVQPIRSASQGSSVEREELVLVLRCVSAGHALYLEETVEDTKRAAEEEPTELAWFEVLSRPARPRPAPRPTAARHPRPGRW